MTFVYELNPYPLEIYRICENKFPTSRLSKVIVLFVLDTRHTYVHTYATEVIYHAASRVVKDSII